MKIQDSKRENAATPTASEAFSDGLFMGGKSVTTNNFLPVVSLAAVWEKRCGTSFRLDCDRENQTKYNCPSSISNSAGTHYLAGTSSWGTSDLHAITNAFDAKARLNSLSARHVHWCDIVHDDRYSVV